LERFEKSKENWSHEVKRASIHVRKRKAPCQEANCQPLAWQTWKVSVRLPDQCRLNDKATTLFEPSRAMRYGRISFEIGKSIGGSVATSK